MITPNARRILNLDELQAGLQKATASVGGLSGPKPRGGIASTQAWSGSALDPTQQTAVQMKTDLLLVADKLETRLRQALTSNNSSLLLCYSLIPVLVVVISVAVSLAIVRESPLLGVLGSVLPGAVVAWSLVHLRRLQDERLGLMVLMGRYESLIVSCAESSALRQVAEQMADGLRQLAGPFLEEAKGQ
jgi:hypothetical protein